MLSVLNENAKPELEVEESEESVRLRLRYEEGEALKPQDFSLKQLQLVLRLTRKYECLRSHAFFITLISDPGLDSGKADTHNWVYFGLFIIAAEFDLQDIAQCVLQQSAHVWASGGNKGYSCTSPLSWTQRQAESVPLRYYVALVRAHLDVPPGKFVTQLGKSRSPRPSGDTSKMPKEVRFVTHQNASPDI